MLYTIKSDKSLAEIQGGLEKSAAHHKFGILADRGAEQARRAVAAPRKD